MARKKIPKPSPRIVELSSEDLKNYVGSAEVPQQTLYEQIKKVQAQVPEEKPEKTSYDPDSDPELGTMGRAMFKILDYTAYIIPLLSVHLVLNILVRIQYAVDFELVDILSDTFTTIPVIAILHTFVHPLRDTRVFRIVSFFASAAIGGYILYASNEEGYYYIMQRAPPLGTIWVWLFIEMDWEWSATSLVVIAFYMWKNGYSL
ncbi:hypothetical protein TRVA0_014S00386 [Trichomonascus vanleenenianus]|uniref:uncharacterized protein n=1 Tax=Trichomonascus vanleenenianus TaxID=2268995 RepID=UPI003EC98064